MPRATRWAFWAERVTRSANVGMSVVSRLSTQKNPMSSKHLMAKLLPAPLMPVMTTKARCWAMLGHPLAGAPPLLGFAHQAPHDLHGLLHGGREAAGRGMAGERLGAAAQSQARRAAELLRLADQSNLQRLGQDTRQLAQLALHQRLELRREVHAAAADDDLHGSAQRRLGARRRWCEGRMPSSSRYLATVRRAMTSPRPLRICATSWSESGLEGSSLASRSWIIFLTEIDDTISPSPEAMPLWKKNFSSKRPCGVSTYLLVVTRLIVDSCMPMSSPTSRRDSGLR